MEVVFRSNSANAKVCFAPEDKNVENNWLPVPSVNFTGGRYSISDKFQNTLRRLREHPINLKNNPRRGAGAIYFWEETKDETNAAAQKEGRIVVTNMPDSLTKEGKEALEKLAMLTNRGQGQPHKVAEAYELVTEIYGTLGHAQIKTDWTLKRMRADVTKLMYALADEGIDVGLVQ